MKHNETRGVSYKVYLPEDQETNAALQPFDFATNSSAGVELWNYSFDNVLSRGKARLYLKPPPDKWTMDSANGNLLCDFDISGKWVVSVGSAQNETRSVTCLWDLSAYTEDLSWKSQPRPSWYEGQPAVPTFTTAQLTNRPGDGFTAVSYLGAFGEAQRVFVTGRNMCGNPVFNRVSVLDMSNGVASSSFRYEEGDGLSQTSHSKIAVDPYNPETAWTTTADSTLRMFDTRTLATGPSASVVIPTQHTSSAISLWKKRSMNPFYVQVTYRTSSADTRPVSGGHYVFDIRNLQVPFLRIGPDENTPKVGGLWNVGESAIYQNIIFSRTFDDISRNHKYEFWDIDQGGKSIYSMETDSSFATGTSWNLNDKNLVGSQICEVLGCVFQ